MTKEIQKFGSEQDLKKVLAKQYINQINNYFGNEKRALRFLSGVMAAVQRNPKLLECEPTSVINSFMTMAQLELMPSDVSGEAYVIPYSNNKKVGNRWEKVLEAQFQLGYQGLVTLFYRSGVKEIVAEIVYENDQFQFVNGKVHHEPDVFTDDRGKAKGAYVIIRLKAGGEVTKVMSKKEIMDIAKQFSKSYSGKHSPWDEKNDPQLWMWRKTALKQMSKLVPKNDAIRMAVEQDNKDSNIEDKKIGNIIAAVDMDECEAKLRACTTVEELGRVWSALPVEAKEQFGELKDEMKEQINATDKKPEQKDEPAKEPTKAEKDAKEVEESIKTE